MSGIAESLSQTLTAGGFLALPFALLGGVVTGLNPCCLPLFPAAAATCCATRDEGEERNLARAAAFVFGVALATTVLGIVAVVAGRSMTAVAGWAAYAIAFVPLIMAAHLLGFVRIPMPTTSAKGGRRGIFGALVAGLLLSLILVPCGTPVLVSVLSFAAIKGSVSYGAVLLFVYGLGAGLPVLVVGTAAGKLARRFELSGARVWVDRVTGVALLGGGLYLVWVI